MIGSNPGGNKKCEQTQIGRAGSLFKYKQYGSHGNCKNDQEYNHGLKLHGSQINTWMVGGFKKNRNVEFCLY